ncbi:MAG: hypothetical protein PHW83_07495 [Bacteroidales bacterium]|nr:hypothetical protein [Bacteroidales bacterium]
MSYYPIIKIPQKLQDVKSRKIPIPPEPPEPKKPIFKNPTRKFIVITSVIAVIIVIAAISHNNSETFLRFYQGVDLNGVSYALGVNKWQLILACVPFLMYLVYLINKNTSKSEYQLKLNVYHKEYKLYQIELEQYLLMIAELQSPINLKNYHLEKTYEYLKFATKPDIKLRNVNKGRFEDLFYLKLQEYFGTKITNNLQLGYFENPYVPDFVYADEEKKLFIDIEIDEPYILNTGESIHWLGIDDQRDIFFNNNHWLVIRFSETQIAHNPDNCCKQISILINHILSNKELVIIIEPQKQWTKDEAIEMYKQNYRERIKK